MTSKKWYVLWYVFFAILGLLAGMFLSRFVADFVWRSRNGTKGLEQFDSPNSAHTIRLTAVGDVDWLFGRRRIHIRVDNSPTDIITPIEITGWSAVEHTVEWSDHGAEVSVDADGAERQAYQIEFTDTGFKVKIAHNAN